MINLIPTTSATLLLTLLTTIATAATPTTRPWSVRAADSIIARHPQGTTIERRPESTAEPKWSYSVAFAVYAIAHTGIDHNNPRHLQYARDYLSAFIDDHGVITSPTYKPDDYKLDDVAPGALILLLNRAQPSPRWLNAATTLAAQLDKQPRTEDRGFWHKQIYPHQMWLDGIFMASPFMAEFARLTNQPRWADDAAHQILTIAKHTHDPKTNLYFHGWDESRSQRWADKQTGLSPCLWGRAVGWYMMGIVQTLEQLPADHPRRPEILTLLSNLADAVTRVQDPDTGLWFQILDQPTRPGNYLESSASCMFTFSLAKAVRLGFLPSHHLKTAQHAYAAILKHFIEVDPAGQVTLKDTCQVAGLGGNPYRDGSFDYYIREPRIPNDPKGLAPFILASLEFERLTPAPARP